MDLVAVLFVKGCCLFGTADSVKFHEDAVVDVVGLPVFVAEDISVLKDKVHGLFVRCAIAVTLRLQKVAQRVEKQFGVSTQATVAIP